MAGGALGDIARLNPTFAQEIIAQALKLFAEQIKDPYPWPDIVGPLAGLPPVESQRSGYMVAHRPPGEGEWVFVPGRVTVKPWC